MGKFFNESVGSLAHRLEPGSHRANSNRKAHGKRKSWITGTFRPHRIANGRYSTDNCVVFRDSCRMIEPHLADLSTTERTNPTASIARRPIDNVT
jgi:hypothetical protein